MSSSQQGAASEPGSRRGGRGGRRNDTESKAKTDTKGPSRDEKKPRDDRKSRVKKEKTAPPAGPNVASAEGGAAPNRGRRRDAPKRDPAAPRGKAAEPTAATATPASSTTVVQSASTKKRSRRDKKEKRERVAEKERRRGDRDRKGRDRGAATTSAPKTATKAKAPTSTTTTTTTTAARAPRSTTRVLRMGLPIDSLEATDDVHLLTLRNLEWGVTEKDITAMIGAEGKLRDLLASGGIKVQYVSKGHGRRPVAALTPQEAISRSTFAPMIGSGLFDTSMSDPILSHYASYFGGLEGGKAHTTTSTVPATPSISTSHAIIFVANPAHIPLVAAVFDGKEVGQHAAGSTRLQCIVEHAPTQPTSCRPPTLPAGGNLYGDGDFYLFAQKMVRQQRAVDGHVNKLDAKLAATASPEGAAEGGSGSGGDKPAPATLRSRLPQPSAASEGGLSSVVSKPPGGKVDGIGFDFSEVEIAALERGLKEVAQVDSSASGATPEDDADEVVKMRLQAWVMASQAADMKRDIQVRSVFDGEDVDADESEVGQNKMLAAVMKSWVGPSGVAQSRGGRRATAGTGEGVVLQQLRDARREEKDKAEAERIHKIIEARRTEKKERDAEIRRKEQAASDAARQLGVLTEPTAAPVDIPPPPRTEPSIRIAKRQPNTTTQSAAQSTTAASSSSFTVTSSRQGAGVMGVKKR